MPTAARLFAALSFAIVAYLASEQYKPLLPEGTPVGLLSPINAFIGLLSGWFIMGPLARQGHALASGIRTVASMLFYILLAHSIWQMLKLSMRGSYKGPADAVIGIFDLAYEYGLLVITSPGVMGILLIGGALAALLSQWAAHRWN